MALRNDGIWSCCTILKSNCLQKLLWIDKKRPNYDHFIFYPTRTFTSNLFHAPPCRLQPLPAAEPPSWTSSSAAASAVSWGWPGSPGRTAPPGGRPAWLASAWSRTAALPRWISTAWTCRSCTLGCPCPLRTSATNRGTGSTFTCQG